MVVVIINILLDAAKSACCVVIYLCTYHWYLVYIVKTIDTHVFQSTNIYIYMSCSLGSHLARMNYLSYYKYM